MIKLAELKVRCGIQPREKEDDRLLELLEADAVAYLERATNLYFGPVATQSERLHGGSGRSALLRLRAPLVTLTSVELLAGSVGSTWTQPWASSVFDFTAGDRRLYLVDGSYFPAGRGNLRITYEGGYVAGAEPVDVRAAVASIVVETYRAPRRSQTPVVSIDENGPSALAIPGTAVDLMARLYRSPGT